MELFQSDLCLKSACRVHMQNELSLQKCHRGHKKASDTQVQSDDEIQATTRMHKRALTCYILVKIYLLRKSQTRLNLVSRIIIFRESFAHFRKARQKYSAHSEYFKDDTDTKETIYTQHHL